MPVILYPDDEFTEDLQDVFPTLLRVNCYITREAFDHDPQHNCVGWSIGRTDVLEWSHCLPTMIQWYATQGYVQTWIGGASATIDLWATPNGTFAHASKKYTGRRPEGMPADLWESFLYPGRTITHGRYELRGDTYGSVVASLRRA